MAEGITRVPYPEHPNRCQSNIKGDQCIFLAVENGTMCKMHGGHGQETAAAQHALTNYRLTKWRASVEHHASSGKIKSLREEIGILRMLLEERLETCHDTNDLLLYSGPLTDLVIKIDKVVTSCHRLEGSMGQLLDKSALLQFASEVITIVSDEVKDEVALNNIANRLMARLNEESE